MLFGAGVADAIVDVVETGGTLVKAGLRLIGNALFHSTAVLITNEAKTERSDVARLKARLNGRITASDSLLLECFMSKAKSGELAQRISFRSDPMLGPVEGKEDTVFVSGMVPKRGSQVVLDTLAEMGAERISLSPLINSRA